MKLPKLQDFEYGGKTVIVRADLDLPAGRQALDGNNSRLGTSLKTVIYLLKAGAKVVVIGHRGRPEGKEKAGLSLTPVEKLLREMVAKELDGKLGKNNFQILENLRFNPGEEENDDGFAKKLATYGEIYVNEAFANSHRKHASIVSLPLQSKFKSKKAVGFHFQEEVENLSKAINKPKKPVIIVIGGIKKDKASYIKDFIKLSDFVLVGGKLPEFIGTNNSKTITAKLASKGTDIDQKSIDIFKEKIGKAETIILSGPMGKYEEKSSSKGTREVFKAISDSGAFKIAGGGETEKAIDMLSIRNKFDWVSSGGGAMLEFLSSGTLPGIKALQGSKL